MLRIATDFDVLESQGLARDAALARMRGRTGVYDTVLLAAFARTVGADRGAARVRDVPLAELAAGMTLADDVRSTQGRLIMSRDYQVTTELVERLRNLAPDRMAQTVPVLGGEAVG